MCPVCIATATLVTTGAATAGGFTALAMKKLRQRNNTKKIRKPSKTKDKS